MSTDPILLDTDITSYIVKRRNLLVLQRYADALAGDVSISAITKAELLVGLKPLDPLNPLHFRVHRFLANIRVIPWDSEAADVFPSISDDLRRAGQLIGPMDILIAAHAIALNATLVTNNTRHFSRIPGLRLENWTLTPE